MGKFDVHKEKVLNAALGLVEKGIMYGSGGNISLHIIPEGLTAITPSGKDYTTLSPKDICIVNQSGELVEGDLKPSVETGMHLSVYANRKDVGAVVHTHQIFGSIYTIINEPIPALFDEQVLFLGDRVDVVPYAVSGSEDLKNNITKALANRCNAYILQNHGCMMLAVDIDQACRNVLLLEKTACVYYYALMSGKEVTTLPAEMAEFLFTMMKDGQDKAVLEKSQAGGRIAEK